MSPTGVVLLLQKNQGEKQVYTYLSLKQNQGQKNTESTRSSSHMAFWLQCVGKTYEKIKQNFA